jgi:hypothetical protein
MSPLPLATAIEQLFHLLNEYLVEDGRRRDGDVSQFAEWLRLRTHGELADIVCNNAAVAASLTTLMEEYRY